MKSKMHNKQKDAISDAQETLGIAKYAVARLRLLARPEHLEAVKLERLQKIAQLYELMDGDDLEHLEAIKNLPKAEARLSAARITLAELMGDSKITKLVKLEAAIIALRKEVPQTVIDAVLWRNR